MEENLESKPWYQGQMSREEVEALLKKNDVLPHTHLIRKSTNVPGFIISYKKSDKGEIAHRKITFQDGRYHSVRNFEFSTISDLVRFHAHFDKWILYDKFYESHTWNSTQTYPPPPPPGADYENLSSSSVDSGTTDHNTDAANFTPLDESSMIFRLQKLLQTRQFTQQPVETPAGTPNIRTERALMSNIGTPANVFTTALPEFWGASQGEGNMATTNPFAKLTSNRNPLGSAASQVAQVSSPFQLKSVQHNAVHTQVPGHNPPARAAPQMDSSDWAVLRADVRKEKRLGAGNYGEVWKVEHLKSKKTFAMKTMKAAKMKPADFEREVKVMMTFRHPNLVKTYGVCSDPNESFILIDFLANGSVMDYCKAARRGEKNPLTSTQKYSIAADVLKGMKYLSEENLIHRDLAARNVLLADDLTAKVADFGLALLANPDGGNTEDEGGMGTPWMWTAPEALLGRNRWSTSCDVWSYGVFCWELYTDCMRSPYQPQYKTSAQLDPFLKSGRRLELPDPCHMAPIVTRCWTYDPESRPSFQQLYGALIALGPA